MPSDRTPESSGARDSRADLLSAALDHFSANGVGNASLRQMATALSTSHRMLIYHFGSREALLAAVVEALEARERSMLVAMTVGPPGELVRQAWDFWEHVVETVDILGPLYFELSAQAMRDESLDSPLRRPNAEQWNAALASMWQATGLDADQARIRARLNLAVSRGLLHDFLLTRDRAAVDAAMAMFVSMSVGEGASTS